MKLQRDRFDHFTGKLLQYEEGLYRALHEGQAEDCREILAAIRRQIDNNSEIISTSKELDYFLQLSMLYITAYLTSRSPNRSQEPFKATTSVFHRKHNSSFLIKPCYYYPGICSVQHPTIALEPLEDTGQIGLQGRIGHAGLTLLRGQVLYCTRPTGQDGCRQYIALAGHETQSAISIPLLEDLESPIQEFLEAEAPEISRGACQLGKEDCDCPLHQEIKSQTNWDERCLGVINLDCRTDELTRTKARELLRDEKFKSTLQIMTSGLKTFRREREKYKVIRTCTSLFQLAQHNLSPRQAYRALLREVSEMCEGADVSLHFVDLDKNAPAASRQLFDAKRSIYLVDGVGQNFRSFLINERYGMGEGLNGIALEKKKPLYITKEQILQSFRNHSPNEEVLDSKPRYKQLMPKTCLNLAIPLAFHDYYYGTINIEWSEEHLLDKTALEIKTFVEKKEKLACRLADYLTLACDYYDDIGNIALTSESEDGFQQTIRETTRQQILAYYVERAIQKILNDTDDRSHSKERSRDSFLKSIIDAVGYLVGFERGYQFRILVSIRRLEITDSGKVLRHTLDHGLVRQELHKEQHSAGPAADIPVRLGESVLGSVAELGLPLFGEIIDQKLLALDPLCKKLLDQYPKSEDVPQSIKYIPAGRNPVYEVALPLIFGKKVIGTIDFEFFSAETPENKVASRTPKEMQGHELLGFLEWARAITYCMAIHEDRPSQRNIENPAGKPFRRFQDLTAQIIANVPIQDDQADDVAEEYFRELINFDEISVSRFENHSIPEDYESKEHCELLRYRSQPLGQLCLAPTFSKQRHRGSSFPSYPEGPGGTVKKLMASYYSWTTLRYPTIESDEFIESIKRVGYRLKHRHRIDSADNGALNAGDFILKMFKVLHEEIYAEFESGDPDSGYGWFLFCVDHEQDGQASGSATFLRCGRGPQQRWGHMNTYEMDQIAAELTKKEHYQELLKPLRRHETATELLQRARDHEYSEEIAREIILELLVGKDYLLPDISQVTNIKRQSNSFTLDVAITGEPRTSVDLSMNPFRSAREMEWFYDKTSYSVMGIPIKLRDRVVGVMNFLRRRPARHDFMFFKSEEVTQAKKLAETFSSLIESEVQWISLRAPKPGTGASTAWEPLPSFSRLAGEIRNALKEEEANLLGVQCDLAELDQEVRLLCEHSLGSEILLHSSERWETFLEMARDRICAVYIEDLAVRSSDSRRDRILSSKRRLRELRRRATKIIVFYKPSQKDVFQEIKSDWPRLLYQRPEKPEKILEYLRHALMLGLRNYPEEPKELSFLFRQDSPGGQAARWSFPSITDAIGSNLHDIRAAASEVLEENINSLNSWRPLSDWIIYTTGIAEKD